MRRPSASRLVKGSGAYVAGSVIQRGAIFLLLPVLARSMSAEEFGHVGIAVSIFQLLALVLTFGIENTVLREWYRARDDRGRRAAIEHASAAILLAAPLGAATAMAAAWITGWPFIGPAPWAVLIAGGTATAVLTAVPLAALRAQGRLRDYLRITIAQAIGTVLVTVIAVLGVHGGATGWIAGIAVGSVLGLAVAARRLPWPTPHRRHLAGGVSLLVLGLPLLPHLAAQWGLQLSDRVLATNLLAASQLGGLSLAFNLIVPLAVISTGVMQAMQPVFASMNREGAGVAPLQRGIAMQIGILGLATAATAGLGPLAISLLFPASLASGADVLPLLAIGIGIWGLYSIPMNVITLVVGNVRWVWALTVGTFLAKAASLLFLLPEGDPSLVGWNFIAANVLLLSVFTAFAATSAAGRRCLAPRALAPPLGIAVTSVTAVVVLVRLDLPSVVSGSAVLGVLGLQALAALALTRVRAADDAVTTIARDAVGGRVGDRLESG